MTYRGEIPGFRYDEVKGKYFRIQANHRLPQGASHSRQNVKAEKKAKKLLKQNRNRQQRQDLELIRRSPWLTTGRSLIATKLGQNPQANVDHVQFRYTRHLAVKHSMPAEIWSNKPNNFVFSRAGAFCALSSTSGFASILCPKSRTTGEHLSRFVLPGHYRGGGQCLVIPHLHPYDYFVRILYAETDRHTVPGLYTVRLDECGRITPDGNFVYILPRPETQIWDLASSPTGTSWALAGGEGLYIGDARNTASLSLRHQKDLQNEQRIVMFRDNNIVMSGERSGRINLTDIRVRKSIQRLQHSSAVNGIVNAKNQNQVIVGGFSSVALYDLRFDQPTKPPLAARARSSQSRSRPLLNFSFPKDRAADQYCQGRQLTYSSDLDIVAHATTHSGLSAERHVPNITGRVTLYSGSTGRVLPSPLTDHRFDHEIDALEIRRVRDGPESIFVLSGDDLQEWSLYDQGEGDDSDSSESGQRKPSGGKYDAEFVRGIEDIYGNA